MKSIVFKYYAYCVKTLNDELIAVALANNEIQIYNFNKMEIVKTITLQESSLTSLNLLKNGDLLCWSDNGQINLFKMLENN